MYANEKERVTEISRNAGYAAGISSYTIRYGGEIFMRHMRPGSVLELGPAEGVMTDILFPHFSDDYTIVDGADFFVEALKQRHSGIKGEVSLFEDYEPGRKFSNIILGHVLEHVEDPCGILKKCSAWITGGGGGYHLGGSSQL